MSNEKSITPQQLIDMWKNERAIIDARADEARKALDNRIMNTVLQLMATVEEQGKKLAELNSLESDVKTPNNLSIELSSK